MRISTSFSYYTSAVNLENQQNNLFKTQQQIGTGRRIVSPSDDPIGATHALMTSQSLAQTETRLNNIAGARNTLTTENNLLTAISGLLLQARDIAGDVGSSGNPTTKERTEFANFLTTLRDSLIGYANEKDSEGNYIFSGLEGGTKPYTFVSAADNTTVPPTTNVTTTYNGDNGQRSINISQGRNMTVSDPGPSVFGATPNDVFTTINQLIHDLSATTSITVSALEPLASTAYTTLSNALTNVETVNAFVGSRVQELSAAETTQKNLRLQFNNELSRVESVDMQQAAVTMKLQETSLQAAQQTFVNASRLSLFNYL